MSYKFNLKLESLMQRLFDLQPEVDLGQIDEFTRRAPQRVKVVASKGIAPG